MPKTPDDMSSNAVERRANKTAADQEKARQKAAEPPPKPKVRVAKKR